MNNSVVISRVHALNVGFPMAGLVVLVLMTSFAKQPLTYDEPFYAGTIPLLRVHGFSTEFLREMKNVSAGPLYAVVHLMFEPLTGLTAPGMRLLNNVLLILTLVVLYFTLRPRSSAPFATAISAIGIPMTWVVSGLALTEIPAMLFFALSMFFLLKAEKSDSARQVFLSAISGLLLGIAALGRQPYIVVLLAMPLLFRKGGKIQFLPSFTVAACTLLVAMPVFIVWGGFVPPQGAWVGKGFAFNHLFLGYAYSALVLIILSPAYLFDRRTPFSDERSNGFTQFLSIPFLIGGFVLLLIVNSLTQFITVVPLASFSERIFSKTPMAVYSNLTSALFLWLGCIFVVACIIRAYEARSDPVKLFLIAAVFLEISTCGKMTAAFSSRYVAVGLPLFILISDYWTTHDAIKSFRVLIGTMTGVAALATYYAQSA